MPNYYMLGGDGKEYGPVSSDQLRQWSTEGRANSQTQVRTADGGSWVPLGAVPELNAPAGIYTAAAVSPSLANAIAHTSAAAGGDTGAVKRLASIMAAGSGWAKFVAIMLFIFAAGTTLMTLGLGLIVAWLPIWLGIALWSAASKAQQAVFTGGEHDLAQALDKIRFYFKLQGITMIVYFCVIILWVAFSFFVALSNFSGLSRGLGQ